MARPSKQSFGSLDDLYAINEKFPNGRNKLPSAWERAQMSPEARYNAMAGIASVNPNLLGLAERGATPSGRSSLDPERMAEKEARVRNKWMNQQLSPFNQAGGSGRPMPQRMANDSVFGAMGGAGQFTPQGLMQQTQNFYSQLGFPPAVIGPRSRPKGQVSLLPQQGVR